MESKNGNDFSITSSTFSKAASIHRKDIKNENSVSNDSRIGNQTTKTTCPAEVANESKLNFCLEIFVPFLLAGCGTVATGILLDNARRWTFFQEMPEALILVPALLGLKGNLEMTLASRLSTMANLGQMESFTEKFRIFYSNIALVQVQAIIIALLASFLAAFTEFYNLQEFYPARFLCLILSAIAAASIASFVLTALMVIVANIAKKGRINPDNVTTLLAAAAGDITSLAFLIFFGSIFYRINETLIVANVVLLLSILASVPLWAFVAYKIDSTRNVLKYGWISIFSAMLISSGGGYILRHLQDNDRFKLMTLFQPVINGVGGNLVAIQASKISTYLHLVSELGVLPAGERLMGRFIPMKAFSCRDRESANAVILSSMNLLGQTFLLGIIFSTNQSIVKPACLFILAYLFASVVQVFTLLYICQLLCRTLWVLKFDPDNNAIPILTALGDLTGTTFLALAFYFSPTINSGSIIETETYPSGINSSTIT